MRKLKGALKLTLKQDIVYIFLPIILTCIFFYIDYLDIKDGIESSYKITDYLKNVSYMAFMDYIFTFSSRYFVYSNFSSSKNLFYKAIEIIIFIKSFALTLLGILFIIGAKKYYQIKGIEFSIILFGHKYQNITFSQRLMLFVLLFILILSMYSVSILIASKNKFTFLFLTFSLSIVPIISNLILNKAHSNSYYYIISAILLLITYINFKVGWIIFKKKSSVETSSFLKLCESMSPNCEK